MIVWFPGQSFDQSSETWRSLARVASLCNRATFKPNQEGVPIPKVQFEFILVFFVSKLLQGKICVICVSL